MRSVIVVALIALVTASDSADDKLLNAMVDKLIDRLSMQADQEDLDDTTLAKPAGAVRAPMSVMQPAAVTPFSSKVSAIQDTLKKHGVQPSKMQELALTAMAGNPMSCSATRDVSASAQRAMKQVFTAMGPEEKVSALEATNMVKINAEDMAGVSLPLGFWDPLGISASFQDGTGSQLIFFREAELKHGRVCMLAFLGIVAGETVHPFFGGNIDLPAAQVRQMFLETDFKAFWLAALVGLGALEVFSVIKQYDEPFWEFDGSPVGTGSTKPLGYAMQIEKQDRIPGDIGWDPLGMKPKDPVRLKDMQTKEINNGRLAMLAVTGILMQEMATGEKVFGALNR
jgi:hypothetical protein